MEDIVVYSICIECHKKIQVGRDSGNHYVCGGDWLCKECAKHRFHAVVCPKCGCRNSRDKIRDRYIIVKFIRCNECGKKILNR